MNAPCSPFLMITMLRAALHDPARRLHEVRLLGELPRLAVVERDEVDVLEQLEQIGAAALDPEVHRVARDELRLLDLAAARRAAAADRCCARKTNGALRNCSGIFGREVREHAEVRLERLGRVEVVAVAAAPAERLARPPARGPPGRRRARASGSSCVHRVVVADDADELHRRRDGSPTRRRTSRSRRARRRPCRTEFRRSRARRSRRRERSWGVDR